jgi:hypothetical protein
MRPDMFKVIVERERGGPIRNYHHARNKKKFASKDLEEALTYEGMQRRHKYFYNRHGKELNENLSPLKGFLRSRVGKPWNKVYSELNEFVNPRSAVQKHIREHVDSYVELHAIKDEHGNYSVISRYRRRYLREGELYVNGAGILCRNKIKPSKIKLLPGQKLYTIYRQATHRAYGLGRGDHWNCDIKCCLHEVFEKMPVSPYIERVMTFVACSREDIAEALKEYTGYGIPVMVVRVAPK